MKDIRKGVIFSLAGDFLSKIPLYIAELILVSALNTRSYGLWTALQVVLRAFLYTHFGLLSAFNKLAPLQYGQQDNEDSRKLNNVVHSFMILLGLVFFIVLAGVSLFAFAEPIGGINGVQFVFFGIIGFLIQNYTYHQARLKNETDYFRMSVGLLIYSCSFMIFIYLFSSKWQLTGALLALLLAYLLSTLYYQTGRRIEINFDYPFVKRLLVQGAPFFIFTIVHFMLQMTDRVVLMLSSNLEMLALYGFSYLACQAVLLMVNAIDRVFSTFSLRLIGAGDHSEAGSLSLNSMWITAMGAAIAYGGYFFAGEWLIGSFFEKYTATIEPIFYMLTGIYFFSSVQPAFSFIIGQNGEKILIGIHAAMIIVTAGLTTAALLLDHSFLSFSKALMVSQFLYFLAVSILFVRYYLKNSSFSKQAKYWMVLVAAISFPLAASWVITHGLEWLLYTRNGIGMMIVYFILYLILVGLLYWRGYYVFRKLVYVKSIGN